MTAGPARPLDVLIIGGGQAGLSMGYHLAQRDLRFEIVVSGAEPCPPTPLILMSIEVALAIA